MIAEDQSIRTHSLPDRVRSTMVSVGVAAILLGSLPAVVAEVPGRCQVRPLPRVNRASPASVVSRSSPRAPLHVASRLSELKFGDLSPASSDDLGEQPITSVTTDIGVQGGEMPENVATEKMAELAMVSYDSVTVRQWAGLQYCWDAPVLSHGPLYFEEVNLERHGYGPKCLRAVQPVLSGAQFFATVPALPYKIAARPPCHPVYTLGRYRPGSPVPYRVNYPPLSLRGGVAEAGVAVGLIFLIP